MRDDIDPVNLEIGERIRKIRITKSWSQKILAKKAGITIQSVLYIEKGKRGLSSHTIRSISNALEVTSDYILFGRTGFIGDSGIAFDLAGGLSEGELAGAIDAFGKVAEVFRRYKDAIKEIEDKAEENAEEAENTVDVDNTEYAENVKDAEGGDGDLPE